METKGSIAYDIVVIGAGVAGVTAALFCAQRGKSVLLLDGSDGKVNEDNSFESIHPGVITLLNFLKIDIEKSNAIISSYSYISDGINIKSLNPYNQDVWSGYNISKRNFIRYLVDVAKEQQLNIQKSSVASVLFDGSRVMGVRTVEGQEIYAKYTIDASGHKRLIGKQLGFIEQAYSPPLVAVTGISNCTENLLDPSEAFFFSSTHGWTWVASLSSKLLYWTKISPKGKVDLSGPKQISVFNSVTMRVSNMRWRIFRPLCIEGGILCGDAAHLIDPASGQGIFSALTTAIKAAETAINCIDYKVENISLVQYDDFCFRSFDQKVMQLRDHYKMLGIMILD